MSMFGYYNESDLDGLSPADRDMERFVEKMDYPGHPAFEREIVGSENDNGYCSVVIEYTLKHCTSWGDEVFWLKALADEIERRHTVRKPRND